MVDQVVLVITGHAGLIFTERCLAKVGLFPPIATGNVATLQVPAACDRPPICCGRTRDCHHE